MTIDAVLDPIQPDDPRYQTLSEGFNQRWVSEPSSIYLISTDDDALEAVRKARESDLDIKVRGGGHCYEGFLNTDGGVILDLSLRKNIYATKDKYGNDAYCIEAGCTNWEVYTTLFKRFNRTIPAGSCYSVGVGGHICGGGYGLLSRRNGLTVDYLCQVDLITVADGKSPEVQQAHRDDTGDLWNLFWAHTGGGGNNFGVILRYYFADLPKPPERVWLSSIAWSWETLTKSDFITLVTHFGDFHEEHGGPQDPYKNMYASLKLTHKDNGAISLLTQWADEDRTLLDRFIAEMTGGLRTTFQSQTIPAGEHFVPNLAEPRQMPWLQATMTVNGSGPNQRGKYKSAYMRHAFPDSHKEAMWKWLSTDVSERDMSQVLLQVISYGCQINTREPSDAATPQRDSIMKCQYQAYWADKSQDDGYVNWMRGFYEDVYKETGGIPEISTPEKDLPTDGCYVNYPDVDLGTHYARLYYKGNYTRLQETKERWDPYNVFHHEQSIRPFTT